MITAVHRFCSTFCSLYSLQQGTNLTKRDRTAPAKTARETPTGARKHQQGTSTMRTDWRWLAEHMLQQHQQVFRSSHRLP